MPRPHDGNDLNPARNTSVLRGVGFGVAVVLGAVAIWLIVTSTTQKRMEIGVLAGLWGLLLGAFSVFGSRHPQRADAAAAGGQELALRKNSEVERADDAAARRHFEARLEHMMRREIQTSMAREVSALRDEVSQLRTELLDKVGGQMQLERIETTRVIGSDIEALQREINQLKGARLFDDPDQAPPITRVSTSRVLENDPSRAAASERVATVRSVAPKRAPGPAPVADDIEDAHIVEDDRLPPLGPWTLTVEPASTPPASPQPVMPPPPKPIVRDPVVREPVAPEPAVAHKPEPFIAPSPSPPPAPVAAEPKPQPFPAREPPAQPAPPAQPTPAQPAPPVEPTPAQPVPQPPAEQDPFAALPRLRPFTDFELDPIEPTPAPEPPPTAPSLASYSGRRRAGDPDLTNRNGRHGTGDEDEGGGRRRRRSEADDDVLARILQRENVR